MLFALLLGGTMNYLSADERCKAGIEFCARSVLRIGVALLGLRMTTGQIAAMGWQPVVLVILSVVLTIAVSIVAARLLGYRSFFGVLTGGAVAICGASAAMALSAALPNHPLRERATLITVIGVSVLSTLAMIIYPMIVHAAGLDPVQAGVFLGGTIHDVAQVVGAGYGMSSVTGDAATFVKLLRVAMLLPVIVFAALLTRRYGDGAQSDRPPLLPWFAVGFGVLVAINSMGWVPVVLTQAGSEISRWCLISAIAAIGMKTQVKEFATVGFKPIVLMVSETLFLAVLVLGLLRLGL